MVAAGWAEQAGAVHLFCFTHEVDCSYRVDEALFCALAAEPAIGLDLGGEVGVAIGRLLLSGWGGGMEQEGEVSEVGGCLEG